jgi:hypothetical protein
MPEGFRVEVDKDGWRLRGLVGGPRAPSGLERSGDAGIATAHRLRVVPRILSACGFIARSNKCGVA